MGTASPTRSTPRHGAIAAALKLLGAALSLVVYVGFARVMSPAMFGELVVLLAAYAIASAVGCFGAAAVALRFIAEAESQSRPDLAAGAARFALGASLVAGTLAAGILALIVLIAGDSLLGMSTTAGLLAAALTVPTVLILALAGILQGLHRVVLAELLVGLLRVVLLAVPVGVAWLAAQRMTAVEALSWNIFATVVALVAAAVAVAVVGRRILTVRPRYEVRPWFGFAASFSVVLIAAGLAERVDLLMLSALAGAEPTAIYGAGSRCAQVVIFVVNALGATAAPRIAALAPDLRLGRGVAMEREMRHTARLIAAVTTASLVATLLLGGVALRMFGPIYEQAHSALAILVTGQAVASLFGPGAVLASFTGENRVVIAAVIAGMALNATLNLLLVPTIGIEGAAFGAAGSAVLVAVLLWLWARHRYSISIGVVTFRLRGTGT
ncbi:MAG: oligosaccharide flippase family protein [Alphaproteobacteria bacterium]|nr:oligosaccharide flippase family protein [Alphaproteobacteria bacterium]